MESPEALEDSEGNSLMLTLERKSVQPYRTQDEYLYAMKEDLAEWFNTLYNSDLTVNDFFEQLETGVLLCQHANNVNGYIVEKGIESNSTDSSPSGSRDLQELASQVIPYKSNVKAGTFQSRDNISNFIGWCRRTLGIPDTLLFESDDLVMRKNERNVVLCLLEVARRGARYGMLAPILIQLEVEIDAEIAGEEPPPAPPQPQKQRITIDMMSLDEMVREMAKLCTCPDQFPIIRVSEGKYKVGESMTLIFVRILRNHVMVRIGGGWDTLQNYLNRHDPCRCAASKSHKNRRFSGSISHSITPTKRRSSMPSSNGPLEVFDVTRSPSRQLPATPGSADKTRVNGDVTNQQEGKLNAGLTPRSIEKIRQAHDSLSSSKSSQQKAYSAALASPRRPQSPSPSLSSSRTTQSPRTLPARPGSPAIGRRTPTIKSASAEKTTPSSGTPRVRRSSLTSGALHSRFSSSSDLSSSGSDKQIEPVKPQPKRPASAGPGSHARTYSKEVVHVSKDRGQRTGGDSNKTSGIVRSRSVGATELIKHLIKSPSLNSTTLSSAVNDTGLLTISGNISDCGDINSNMNGKTPVTNGFGSGSGPERRLNNARVKISPDKLLPDKPKTIMRSQSIDHEKKEASEASEKPSLRRQGSTPAFSSTVKELSDIPVPEANTELNQQMEKLFEEYRRIEKGWFKNDDASINDEIVNITKEQKQASSKPITKRPASAGGVRHQPSSHTPRSSKDAPVTSSRISMSTSSSSSSLSSVSGTGRVCPPTPTRQRRPITPVISGRSTPPSTPGAQRRSVTPVRPIPVRPATGSKVTQPDHSNSTNTRGSSVRRESSVPRVRSQTPDPERRISQVRVQSRPKTPLVKMSTEDIKPRTNTGLRGRPTTPVSSNSSNKGTQDKNTVIRRSSSLSRAAINNALSTAGRNNSVTRVRSQSKEDILDSCGTERVSSERVSRSDTTRKRDMLQNNGSRPSSRTESVNKVSNDIDHKEARSSNIGYFEIISDDAREPHRCLPPTPGMLSTAPPPTPVTVEIPEPMTTIPDVSDVTDEQLYAATPRKDDREGRRTLIPRPSSAMDRRCPTPELGALKRFDSGVDINISPTESSSTHAEEDMCLPWQHSEAVPLSPQALAFAMSSSAVDQSDDYY